MSTISMWRLMAAFTLVSMITMMMTACGQGAPSGQAGVLASNKPRDASPGASEDQLGQLVAGNTAFALSLYEALRSTQQGNLFISPHSISIALAMTYAGAQGETGRQMAETMHFNLPQADLHAAFNKLDLELAKRGEDIEEDDGVAFQLNIANSLWGQKEYPFLPEFLDVLAVNYGAGLRLIDFAADPEGSRQEINQWVEGETGERIKDLIPPGIIDDLTRLVLANAVYFNAGWLHPFEEGLTQPGPFNLLNGDQVSVPMMAMSEPVPLAYGSGDGYLAVELPYRGNQLGMVVLLPDEERFDTFERALDAGQLQAILDSLEPQMVALRAPKFEYESDVNLSDQLTELGMPSAFDSRADFSGMDGRRDLFIQAVLHKAFVSVDEFGTEAAAATAVIISLKSLVIADIEVTIDRPFIFLIRDFKTGAILFLGRVLDPS